MQDLYCSDFFVLRTPLLSFNKLLLLLEDLRKGYNSEIINSRSYSTIFCDEQLLEAIYIASPSLYIQLRKYLNNEIKDKKTIRNLYKSLYKYYSRMCTRCTPFGLFSGCSTGYFEKDTFFNLKDRNNIHRHLRLDMDFLCKFVSEILSQKEIREDLFYYPNTSIYKLGNQYRFVEYRYHNDKRTHHLVTIDYNAITKYILECAKKGTKKRELIRKIVERGYSEEDSELFIDDLIDNQVIKSDLDANVSGKEYADEIVNIIEKIPSVKRYYNILKSIQEKIKNINETPSVNKYSEIVKILTENKISFNEAHLFQVDLVKPSNKLTLSDVIKDSVLEGVEVLINLNPMSQTNLKLEQFKRAFAEKYEDRVVSISEVLDTESGLGYKQATTIQDIYKGGVSSEITPQTKYKNKMYEDVIKNKAIELVINPNDISMFKRQVSIPNSFGVMTTILKNKDERSNIFIKSISGPSGANLLGRFCHSDKDMFNNVLKLVNQEEELDADKIFAEIVHLPQSRVGNVLSRPNIRKFEIPYLAKSTLDFDNQIRVDDLFLKMDKYNNRIILYSKKLGKEVIPRMSNAHNYSFDSLPIYHFLCDLQGQNIQRGIFWNWESLNNEDFLPRVRYKNVIFNLATWNLKYEKFQSVFNSKEKFTLFDKIRNEINLPNYITIIEGDNELFLDIGTEYCVDLLLETIQKRKLVKVHEYLPNEENLVVNTNEGLLTNEIIIPFVKIESQTKSSPPINIHFFDEEKVKRRFEPGSEWAYFKIYFEKKTCDDFIKTSLLKIVNKLKKKKVIDQYFFIRYSDPKFHLRVRFHLIDKDKYSILMKIIYEEITGLLKVNTIANFQMDTYLRELERYGFKTINKVEELFSKNSDMILNLFNKFRRLDNESFRMTTSILYLDGFLKLWGFDTKQKKDYYDFGVKSFTNEFGLDKNLTLKNQLNDNYRLIRPTLQKLLVNKQERDEVSSFIQSELKNHVEIIKEIKTLLIKDASVNINSFIWSLVHMHVNRVMFDDARRKEMIIYYYLSKFFNSIIAQETKKNGNIS